MTTRSSRPSNPTKWRLIVGVAVIVVALAYLILSSTQGGAVYALTIHELKARGTAIHGRGVRVGGIVDGQSIVYEPSELLLQFTLVDGEETLPVSYRGPRPDMFRDGAQALVEGQYSADGTFQATKLLLTCPSKYEAAATQTAIR